jgi:hypothetical protein
MANELDRIIEEGCKQVRVSGDSALANDDSVAFGQNLPYSGLFVI